MIRAKWLKPSVVVLVVANLVPVYGVVFLKWDVFPILLLFWFENVTIGVFNVLRMLVASPSDPTAWLAKVFMVPFFAVHYGAFTAAHGAFVIGIFGRVFLPEAEAGLPQAEVVLRAVREYHLVYGALCLIASHGFSFAWNYIGKREYLRVSPGALMGKPYSRVVVLHLTIIFGAFLAISLKSSIPVLLILIILKIGVDIVAHRREHRKLGATPPHSAASRIG